MPISELLKYCDGCFAVERPEFCEVYRHRFYLVSRLERSRYQQIREALTQNGIELKKFGSFWGFSSSSGERSKALSMFAKLCATVHTLEEHIVNLRRRYDVPPKQFGPLRYTRLPPGKEWQSFDPGARVWRRILPISIGGTGAILALGMVLRTISEGRTNYYWFYGVSTRPTFRAIQKRAAYNIASLYFRPAKMHWVEHANLGLGIVRSHTLGNLPDDVFYTMVRLRPTERYMKDLMIFDVSDFRLLRTLLTFVKVSLKPAASTVVLPGDADQLHGTPVLALSSLSHWRLEMFEKMMHGLISVEVDHSNQALQVRGQSKVLNITFVDRETPASVDDSIYVPFESLTDVAKLEEILKAIARFFGSDTGSVSRTIAKHLPGENESEANYVLKVLTQYLDEQSFVSDLLSDKKKRHLVRRFCQTAAEDFHQTDLSTDTLKKLGGLLSRTSVGQ